jgi:hypothetical protein
MTDRNDIWPVYGPLASQQTLSCGTQMVASVLKEQVWTEQREAAFCVIVF